MTTSPFLRTLSILTLTALLAQQTQALAQQPAADGRALAPEQSKEAKVAPGSMTELVYLASLSSANAVKGQTIHMAVAKELRSQEGQIVIPRGSQATGVVTRVRKAVPGKKNGELTVRPAELTTPDGITYKVHSINDEGDCDFSTAGCWVSVIVIGIVATPIVVLSLLAFAVTAPFLIRHNGTERSKDPDPKSTPNSVTKEEATISPCQSEVVMIGIKPPAPSSATSTPSALAPVDLDTVCPQPKSLSNTQTTSPQVVPIIPVASTHPVPYPQS